MLIVFIMKCIGSFSNLDSSQTNGFVNPFFYFVGLEHLHEGGPILHHDIKTSNILLSEDMVAKVADLGFSKLLEVGASNVSSAIITGTPGYFDPKYVYEQDENSHSRFILNVQVSESTYLMRSYYNCVLLRII
jgi:serine/threonine protein kinase